jgi:ABC-type lipoprotein release transport system permease subunit
MFRNFRVISKISLRNLVRQRRRNILLGVCIAVGMSILVVTTSFTNGLTDIIFNKLMVYMTGHIRVENTESAPTIAQVMRDTPRFVELIKKTVPGVNRIDETNAAMGRAIGNRKTALLMLIGSVKNNGDNDNGDFAMAEGNFEDIYKNDLYPGIVLFKSTANELNVKLNDLVYVKFDTIYKQPQSPAFKIVGIIRSENMFMDMAALVDNDKLKTLLNLRPEESMGLNVVVDHPGDQARIIQEANALYAALKPRAAGIRATLAAHGTSLEADLFALKVKDDEKSRALAARAIAYDEGDGAALEKDKHAVVVSASAAQSLSLKTGDKVHYSYATKYGKDPVEGELVVSGVCRDPEGFAAATIFAPDTFFYEIYYRNLPKVTPPAPAATALAPALLPEWDLLPRTADTDSTTKKQQALMREKWDGTKVDVSTMYETASVAIDMKNVLNIISIVAVGILFVVIVIGVMNTMRMTIRERTREIGTNRAIGMQRRDVRSVFVYEVLYLSIFACVLGILLGFGLIAVFRLFTFDMPDNPFSMFMVKQHLYFLPTAGAIVICFIVINVFAYLIAFLTARRAANMRAADALRHYE